jgi:signal transduction histidine kinase/ActR/RegA family two-component response regulator
LNILVVEDDEAQRKLLERSLVKAKFEVTVSKSVEDAIACLDQLQFAVAVVDLSLFDKSGLDFVRELVRRSSRTRVIIHTGNASFESAREGIELGVFAYVEKSQGISELVSQVGRASTAYLKDSLSFAEQEIRLQIRLLDSVREGVIASNVQQSVIFANRYALEMLGYSDKEIYGKNIVSLFDGLIGKEVENQDALSWMASAFDGAQSIERDVSIVLALKPGDQAFSAHPYRTFRLQVSQIVDSFDARLGHVLVFSDVTVQKRAELELNQARELANHAQRVSVIGQMAGVLSHEINQPLGAISNFAGGLLLGLEHSTVALPELKSTLKSIQDQAIRASDVLGRLRRFISGNAAAESAVDINQLVVESVKLLECELRAHHVTAETKLEERQLLVIGDRIQLTQVIVNILKNAAEAIDTAGASERCIVITTRVVDLIVQIEVADCGPGISTEYLGRLFEPYFSTKDSGMGLGLSISKTIVENHRGTMSVENRRTGHGVLVQLLLPQSEHLL